MQLIGRRSFFAGLGLGTSAHLLTAVCRTIIPEARGQTNTRKRIFIYSNRLGINPEYLPKRGASETDFTLGAGMAPLEPYRRELLYVTGLHNPFNQYLHGNRFLMSVAPGTGDDDNPQPGGATFDRFLAKEIGKADAWPSLNLVPVPTPPDKHESQSADGPGQVFPYEIDPVKVYAKVFGGGVALPGGMDGGGAAVKAALARKASLLDFVSADVNRMAARLAGAEKAKLDQYLSSVREMERRLTTIAQGSPVAGCQRPGAPASSLGGIRPDDVVRTDYFTAHMDLAVNALACGLTRVVNVQVPASGFYFLGPRVGDHNMWHGGGTTDMHTKHLRFNVEQVAYVRQRLSMFAEGNGTAADTTLLMFFNEAGGQHHNGYNDIWTLLIGSAGGHFKTGRFVSYPRMQHCVSDLYVSIANAMGLGSVQRFGRQEPGATRSPLAPVLPLNKGPLPGLA